MGCISFSVHAVLLRKLCKLWGGRGSKRDEMKELVAQFRNTSSVIETNIFNSVRDINLRTVMGYHKDGEYYNFLDDYDQRGNKGADKEKRMITAKSSFVEEKYTAQYYSGNGCLYVSGAGGVLKGGIHDLTGDS